MPQEPQEPQALLSASHGDPQHRRTWTTPTFEVTTITEATQFGPGILLDSGFSFDPIS